MTFRKCLWILFFGALLFAGVYSSFLYLQNSSIPILEPKGIIASEEKSLIIITTLLMLIVVIPVFIMTAIFSWRYRRDNTKATYTPDWDNHMGIETVWWAIPGIIIFILSIFTWKSSHELHPFKPLESDKKTVVIQAVALDWKWLFLYPEQKIACVNFCQFPEKTPICFEVTADAPMNSFWIPQLGSQIYAMPGMRTKVYLMADEPGSFRGSSANLSGRGFAGMWFTAKASTDEEFRQWAEHVHKTSAPLQYEKLAQPSENVPVEMYALKDVKLFDQLIMKYMMPKGEVCSEN